MVLGPHEASCMPASDTTTVIVIMRRTFGRKCGRNPRSKLSVLVRNNHFVKKQKCSWKERSQAQLLWTKNILKIVDSNFCILRSATQLCDKCNLLWGSNRQLPDWHTCVARNDTWPMYVGFVVNKVTPYLCSIPIYIFGITLNKTKNLESLQILQRK
jgi:hypothetical protein